MVQDMVAEARGSRGPSKDHTAVYFGLTPLLVSIGVSLISIVGSSSSDSESSKACEMNQEYDSLHLDTSRTCH